MTVPFDCAGRVVLVTGASSGIGRRFATILAQAGAAIVLGARRTDMLADLEREIRDSGGKAQAVAMDVGDETSIIGAFDLAADSFGPVDTVVANAGMSAPGSAMGLEAEAFDRMVSVNLRGVFLTAREGARRMVAAGSAESGRGRIILVSSITGAWVPSGSVGYAATKAAVNQMGRAFAKDWALKGINVNVLAPGYMVTELTDEMWDLPVGQKLLAEFPRRRIMSAAALDPILLYLASDESAEVTGSIFTIDDGQTL
ncbi:SDR family NAD(P)-dependent oxidoreductase [Sphingopyxis sp.]|uniref:SDR family NAD(P)-dependent oxidoreductase n=1 Tax=Sphingopyxis sp. TaxID=1908224 RepID=UPI003BAD5D97